MCGYVWPNQTGYTFLNCIFCLQRMNAPCPIFSIQFDKMETFLFMKIGYRGSIIQSCEWWSKLSFYTITTIITILANALWFGPLGSSSDSDLYFLNKALYLWLLCSLYFRSAEYKAGDKSSFCSNAELQYLAK